MKKGCTRLVETGLEASRRCDLFAAFYFFPFSCSTIWATPMADPNGRGDPASPACSAAAASAAKAGRLRRAGWISLGLRPARRLSA